MEVLSGLMAIQALSIRGGKRLRGEITVSGSKNAALPIMAAALLCDEPVTLHRVPDLADIRSLIELLQILGVEITRTGSTMTLRVVDDQPVHAPYDMVRKMRASICVMGPLLARRRQALVSMPGGCAIGARPIDLHLLGMQALGARVDLQAGDVHVQADRLVGDTIFMGGPFGSTVLGTTNVMCAAVLAEGTTVIESAACEPEVVDLAHMLNACGARIAGAGGPTITIEGVRRLAGCTHTVIPDRIEAGTFIMAAAMTNGELTVGPMRLEHLYAVTDRLRRIGVNLELVRGRPGEEQWVRASSDRRLSPVDVVTQPFPGYPTDLQAQIMALLCLADGMSVITEKIFAERFLHTAELLRMGANIRKEGATVIVSGVRELIGAPVMASDLRASAALVLAGLAARGTTKVNRVYHIDRGYEHIERKLVGVGADIERVASDM